MMKRDWLAVRKDLYMYICDIYKTKKEKKKKNIGSYEGDWMGLFGGYLNWVWE